MKNTDVPHQHSGRGRVGIGELRTGTPQASVRMLRNVSGKCRGLWHKVRKFAAQSSKVSDAMFRIFSGKSKKKNRKAGEFIPRFPEISKGNPAGTSRQKRRRSVPLPGLAGYGFRAFHHS